MRISLINITAFAALLALPLGAVAQGRAPHGGNPHGMAPFAGAAKMTCEQALKEVPKDDKSLVPLEKAMNDAQAKMKKNPKDARLKKAYVDATYNYGNTVMMDREKLKPTVMYRASLALYRRALAVDPKHKPSLDNKKMIEDIYRGMGREIPK